MSEEKNLSEALETNQTIAVISFLTRRLVSGYKNEFAQRISDHFDVRINPKVSDTPHIIVKGKDPEKIKQVVHIIRELDHRAQLLVTQEGLTGRDDLKDIHYNVMKQYVKELLKGQASPIESKLKSSEKIVTPEAEVQFNKNAKKREQIKLIEQSFEPRNLSQALVYRAIKDSSVSIVFAVGPAGGGKTYTPLRAAMEAYNEGRVNEILIIRPHTSTGRDPGAMPGDPKKKAAPYIKGGIASNIEKITGMKLGDLENKKIIRTMTPDFERGETYDNAFILVDEGQNLTISEAELLASRIGSGSIMVIDGDISGHQKDLKNQFSGLAHLIASIGTKLSTNNVLRESVAFVKFVEADSSARSYILPHLLEAFNKPSQNYAEIYQEIVNAGHNARLANAIKKGTDYALGALEKASEFTSLRYGKEMKERYPHFHLNSARVVQLHVVPS
jgi:phosphate starvation-inducible protein PhoH and related proteins